VTLESAETEHLFSYGSLQAEAVQLATFGRRLEGRSDSLVGYRIALIPIADPNFVNINGDAHHRNLEFTGIASDLVEGVVFTVTRKELEQADAYEPADYRRVLARLSSGTDAWVYLDDQQT
jgi:hypothetical protein